LKTHASRSSFLMPVGRGSKASCLAEGAAEVLVGGEAGARRDERQGEVGGGEQFPNLAESLFTQDVVG